MKPTIKYRPEDNAATIRLSDANILESAEVSPDVVFDYDAEGHIVGIELLDAANPKRPRTKVPDYGPVSWETNGQYCWTIESKAIRVAYLEHIPVKTYYHYTSVEGLVGIVNSKRLWLSALDVSNDPREVEFGRHKILEAMKRVRHEIYPGHGGLFVSLLAGVLTNALNNQSIYTASLTPLGDTIPLWREYTEGGRGIAIGFRPRALTDMHCRINKVRYISSTDDDEIFYLVAEFIKDLEHLDFTNEPGKIFRGANFETRVKVISSLLSTIYSVKIDGWRYEEELRLSFASQKTRDDELKEFPVTELPNGSPVYWREPLTRETQRGSISYHELPFGKFSNTTYDATNAFAEIVIGPNSEITEEELKNILVQSGMKVPNIVKSKNIFR